jgi:hypothetical protein
VALNQYEISEGDSGKRRCSGKGEKGEFALRTCPFYWKGEREDLPEKEDGNHKNAVSWNSEGDSFKKADKGGGSHPQLLTP